MARRKLKLKVTKLHGYTHEEIAKMAKEAKDKKERNLLLTVSMALEGIEISQIAKILGISYAAVCRYINKWNKNGDYKIKDKRKYNNLDKGAFTEEIKKELYKLVTEQNPQDYGYMQNKWTTKLIKDYLLKYKGIDRSEERIRQVLHEIKLSYKKGAKIQSKGSAKEQEIFKKKSQE